MDHLMVKLKGRGQDKIKRLMSDVAIYNIDPGQLQTVSYAPDHNLDNDCWFEIKNFSEEAYCLDFLKRDFVAAEHNQMPAGSIRDMRYMFSVQGSNYFFQKVTPSQIMRKTFLAFGEGVEVERDKTRVVVHEIPDAIYAKESDQFFFRNLTTISNIFKGIEELYREATEEETRDFLSQPFIELKGGYEATKVGKLNRQRIALAMESLNALGEEEKGALFVYIKDYCDDLNFDEQNKTFEVCDEGSLKNLVYGIEQRFYSTIIGAEKRLANSIVKL
jgi:hypothetical protein